MKLSPSFKKITVEVICYLYILLFVYAAVSKLIDFENFQVQLGQSPLIAAFAGYISIAVPFTELLIVVFLVIPKFRIVGLYASFSLMTMFSAYIFIILNYSSSIPCSCGGVLEKMTWKQHLYFNLLFVVLAGVAIIYQIDKKQNNLFSTAIRLSTLLVLSVGIMVSLQLSSKTVLQYHNTFIRVFPRMAAVKKEQLNLKYNSFYFAGKSASGVFLGNYTTPLVVTEVDSSLNVIKKEQITLDRRDLPFKSVQLSVWSKRLIVYDGTVACIFMGTVDDWKTKLTFYGKTFIADALPIDSNSIVFKGMNTSKMSSNLGTYNSSNNRFIFSDSLLKKQQDGIFDSDGMLHFDSDTKRIVYIYRYRNQYFSTDQNLHMESTGNTIDTISKANIKIAKVASRNQSKLSAPPLVVNKSSAVCKNLLFINSLIMGKYEPSDMWKDESIIDVYDLTDNSYVCSFYIYSENGEKLRSFIVKGNKLFALIGESLIIYKLSAEVTDRYEHT